MKLTFEEKKLLYTYGCADLELTRKRVFLQKSPLDLSFFYKLTGRIEADGHPELFYPCLLYTSPSPRD